MRLKISRKVVIPALSLLIGASIAGSITSTVAWFQYATKATVAITGTTSHCSKLLKISGNNGTSWNSNLTLDDLPQSLNSVAYAPVTTGPQLKNAALPLNTSSKTKFYAQPNIRQGLYANWYEASASSFAQFDILVKVNDVKDTLPQLANDVYLTDVTIKDANANVNLDLSNAIRVHLATTYYDDQNNEQHKYFLFAKNDTSIAVGGYLDVDNDGAYDYVDPYDPSSEKVIYGGSVDTLSGVFTADTQTSYKANDSNIIAAEDSKGHITGGTSIGSTSAVAGKYLKVTVTVWLEGWALLANGISTNKVPENSQIWDSEVYTSKSFNVGLTFGVDIHSANE